MPKILPVVAALAMLPHAALAQAITAQAPDSVAKALQDAGFKAERGKDNGGDPMITSASSGKTFVILFFGCEKNLNCTSIQFYTGFRGVKVDLQKINAWNEDKRFGRAAIDGEGDPVVRMDVNLDLGGISAPLFKDHIDVWTVVMDRFADHIGAR